MGAYYTKQRKTLLDYLESHRDQQISTEDLVKEFKEEEISQSAIYRNLSFLEDEGKIKRCVRQNDRKTYFQFIGSAECHNKIHLSCVNCGKSYHLDPKVEELLVDSISKTNNFTIDKCETTIYGICDECKKNESVLNEEK